MSQLTGKVKDIPSGAVKVVDGNIIYTEINGVTLKYTENCLYYINKKNVKKRILQKHLILYENAINLANGITKVLMEKSLEISVEGLRDFCKAICQNEIEGITYSTMKFHNGNVVASVFTGYFYFIEGFYFWYDKEMINCGYNNIQLKMQKDELNSYVIISKLQDSGIEKFDPNILDTFMNLIKNRVYHPLSDINYFISKDKKHMRVSLGLYKKLMDPIYKN